MWLLGLALRQDMGTRKSQEERYKFIKTKLWLWSVPTKYESVGFPGAFWHEWTAVARNPAAVARFPHKRNSEILSRLETTSSTKQQLTQQHLGPPHQHVAPKVRGSPPWVIGLPSPEESRQTPRQGQEVRRRASLYKFLWLTSIATASPKMTQRSPSTSLLLWVTRLV